MQKHRKMIILALLLALVLLLGMVPGALALEDADIDPGMGVDYVQLTRAGRSAYRFGNCTRTV